MVDVVNIGSGPNAGDGDPLRTAFGAINTKFGNLGGLDNVDFNVDMKTKRVRIGEASSATLPDNTSYPGLWMATGGGTLLDIINTFLMHTTNINGGNVITGAMSGGTLTAPNNSWSGTSIGIKALGYNGGVDGYQGWKEFAHYELGAAVGNPSGASGLLGAHKWTFFNVGGQPEAGMYLGYQPKAGIVKPIFGLSNNIPIYQYNLGWDGPIYGIADNTEVFTAGWAANVYEIKTLATGTGVGRNMSITPAGGTLSVVANITAKNVTLDNGANSTTLLLQNTGVAGINMNLGDGLLTVSGTSSTAGINNTSGGGIRLHIGSVAKLDVTVTGSVILNSAALATTATDGFLYIASFPGTPTGVPTAVTGRVALGWDSVNKKLYVYDGGWRGGTNPGAFT